MKVFDLTENMMYSSLDSYNNEHLYYIVATEKEFMDARTLFDVKVYPQKKYDNFDENIRFESYPNYDFLSYVFFELVGSEFDFEIFNIYYSKKYIAVVVANEHGMHEQFIEELSTEGFNNNTAQDSLTYIYYRFLNITFSKMFDALCSYESLLANMENDILVQNKDFDFDRIVDMKNSSFQAKKCLRLLLYVGDQLLVNDNGLIPESDMRFFRNIDMRINRMYEYASNIHEVSEHLMELYNSAISARTNDLINKLTVFTVFATPLTVLTGIYGMNFVNIPELQHQYGYFILLGVMALILIITFIIMKKLKLL